MLPLGHNPLWTALVQTQPVRTDSVFFIEIKKNIQKTRHIWQSMSQIINSYMFNINTKQT